jgi:hypothetical protein
MFIVLISLYLINLLSYNNIEENFSTNINNLCNIVKDRLNDVIKQKSNKCIKDETKINRDQMNDAIDCYNFTGNEIVSINNVDSWCDLNSTDIDIINKAVENI